MAPRYPHVRWHHDDPDEPVLLLSEVVDDQETRKIELYADGRTGWADRDHEVGGSALSVGEGAFPSEDEIAAQPEFTVLPTSAPEFERAWRAATGG